MRTPITSQSAVAVGPYSHAVDSGTTVYCSGQTPIDTTTGRLLDGDVEARTHQCFDHLFAVLGAAGLGPGDVMKVNVYLTDLDDFAAMNRAYASRFAEPYPARTTVGVAALPLGADVEIELVAQRT